MSKSILRDKRNLFAMRQSLVCPAYRKGMGLIFPSEVVDILSGNTNELSDTGKGRDESCLFLLNKHLGPGIALRGDKAKNC